MDVCERGVGAIMAGELLAGESVALEMCLSAGIDPLRARALVRYQDKLRCGLEFIALSPEQRAAIRDWTKGSKLEATIAKPLAEKRDTAPIEAHSGGLSSPPVHRRRKHRRPLGWAIVAALIAIALAVFWSRWNHAWDEIESGLKTPSSVVPEKPQVQVPAEVMEKLLIHRVQPTYPAEARQQKLEGTIALDVTVGSDGSILRMHPLNGPDVLARAAMDALRWWKFEPYRINGEPVVVETTVAVEFKP